MAVLPELEAFLELAEFGRMTGKSRAMHEPVSYTHLTLPTSDLV